MMNLMQLNFTLENGGVEVPYIMFFDGDKMSEDEALKEAYYADGGCHDPKLLKHFLIVPEYKMDFLKALVRDEKDKSYEEGRDQGYQDGQQSMLEAGYELPDNL